jgi:hypothetical protein
MAPRSPTPARGAALDTFIAFDVAGVAVTWWSYVRKNAEVRCRSAMTSDESVHEGKAR